MSKTAILRPLAIISSTNWTSATVTAIDPLDPVSHDDATSYASYEQPATQDLLRVSLWPKPNDIRTVTSVTARARDRYRDGRGTIKLRVYLGTDSTTGSGWNPTSSWADRSSALGRPGGGDWTADDIAQDSLHLAIFVDSWLDPPSVSLFEDVTSLWLTVVYEPVPPQTGVARDAPGRRLWAMRSPQALQRRVLDLGRGLEFDLADKLLVSHHRGLHASDPGWLSKAWQRRYMVGVAAIEDPNTQTVEWTLLDMRRLLCLYRDTYWALGSAAPWGEGINRFSRRGAVTRTFTRASYAWVPDPSDARIVRVEADQEAYALGGGLIEGARTNLLIQSAFRNGAADTYTGWTKAGTGSGSTIADDSAELWWDSDLVGRSVKYTYATAAAADLKLTGTKTASVAANSLVSVSIAHLDDSGEALYWSLQRDSDSKWWNETGGTWDASQVWNALAVAATWTREEAGAGIDVGSSAVGLTVVVGVPNGSGVDGQVNHLAHVQVEVGAYASSAVYTGAASYARTAARLLIGNNETAPSWNGPQGTFACEVLTGWNAAQLGDAYATVAFLEHASEFDYDLLRFDGYNDRWAFERSRSLSPLDGAASVVAHWEFESDGSDSEAGGYTLTGVNSPTYAPAVLGNGAQLTLVTNKTDSPYFTRTISGGEFNPGGSSVTVALWFKVDSGNGRSQVLFDMRRTTSTQRVLVYRNGTGNVVTLSVNDDSSQATAVSSSTAVVAGDGLVCVVAVIDRATDTLHLYLNGTLENSQAMTGTPADIGTSATLQTLFVGADFNNTGFNLDGRIDRLRLLIGEAWSAADVDAFYRSLARSVVAEATPAAMRDDPRKLVVRRTGEAGELDLAPFTVDLFVDGVQGAAADNVPAVGSAAPVASTSGSLELGSRDSAEHLDGRLRLIHSFQYVATDEECARMPPQ